MHELTNARDKIKDEFRLAEEAARKAEEEEAVEAVFTGDLVKP